MAEPKTRMNDGDVIDFLNSVDNEKRRKDSFVVLELMKTVTGEEPAMWGKTIVDFGKWHYRYESGREGDWMKIAFSPRKQAMTLYFNTAFSDYQGLMEKLGKYQTGKGCLYIRKLEDVDLAVLEELVRNSVASLD